MLKLGPRLQTIVSLVTPGYTVCDVGCDHGYTGIALIESGRSPYVIAADLRTGPLETARANIEAAGLSDRIGLRLSDGLGKIGPGETDTVLISGMGGPLILEILSAYPEKTDAAKELILSPQSGIPEFEEEIGRMGFVITDKHIASEGRKFYFVFRCVKKESGSKAYDRVLPKDTYLAFLEHTIEEYGPIAERLRTVPGTGNMARADEMENEIRRIKDEIDRVRA